MTSEAPGSSEHGVRDTVRLALIVGALGVVFGDLGTSPIYTLQTLFDPNDPHPVPVNREYVFGAVSLVFWSVILGGCASAPPPIPRLARARRTRRGSSSSTARTARRSRVR